MSRQVSTGSARSRPSALQAAKSFTRYEPPQGSPVPARSRASTMQSLTKTTGPLTESPLASPATVDPVGADIFEKIDPEDEEPTSPDLSRSQSIPERFDELPIELMSLTDRFVESLSAKTWAEPPTIDDLSDIFQEFYIKAGSHISTHIATLLSRLNREASPTRSRVPTKATSLTSKTSTDSIRGPASTPATRQMLTASEVAEKRKARKLLEYKRVLLEEAVEKRACEKVYDKIWRHKSTLDEVRDEKLRSKTAALALVGIGLKDLGIKLDPNSDQTEEDIQESLAPAREDLAKMSDGRDPFGKLQHLTHAHKSIVETLSTIHPSSNSADEILPTLIYVLITSPMEGINIISNLYFIQRFRAAAKVDGEAAYCLTNLEAAISFLENVDLASLRADEVPEGPARSSSRPATPSIERPDPFPRLHSAGSGPAIIAQRSTTSISASTASATSLQAPLLPVNPQNMSPLPSPRHQRTLSNLLHPSAKALGAASDAARNSAEEGFKNITNTLDNSFKFLFGRLKERSDEDGGSGEIVVPKTLDEARALVSRPMTPNLEDEVEISEASSLAEKEKDSQPPPIHAKPEDRLLSVIGGRKTSSTRERSVDSVRSHGSGGSANAKKVAFAESSKAPLNALSNPLDSVKNLGNSLNPLSHIGNAFGGGFRGFGVGKVTPASPPAGLEKEKGKEVSAVPTHSLEALERLRKIDPPVQRFMDMENVGELRVGDLEQLLREYQRLARVLKDLAS